MINKKTIDKMLEMPDDRLIPMIKLIFGTMGGDADSIRLEEGSIKKLRALLSEITDEDIERVSYLVGIYKSKV